MKKCVNGSRILVLGVAYKRDISDVRESPALDIIRLLQVEGAQVDYADPYVPRGRYRRSADGDPLSRRPRNCQTYDLVAVVTDHSCFRFPDDSGQFAS